MIFVYLHILFMVTAVTITFGPAFLTHRAATTGNVPTIRATFGMAGALGPFIPVTFGLGFLFALIAIFTGGYNPFRPWLLIAYVLFAIGMIDGFRVHTPYALAVGKAAAESPDEAPSAELVAALDNRAEQVTYWVDIAIIAVILFDMVIKPFGA